MCEQLTVRRDSTYSQVSASKKEMCKNETENATLYTGTFPAPPAPRPIVLTSLRSVLLEC